ncbi:hypothetical protein BAUCODRAFT_121704 [Baudoinia panamericana UAMH 10762]|uniref:Zn(2)-C6 fungal-type domain-containing protein n=1 Tax=Baudoinia panamericana (strain UAMH 10762) TaxID=717646 RepID=M2MZY1_BAUPA|nr:uncharacterized protein BAUCODRAFT_121704 [Baudoinia panamericana UAMH 10762]EMC97203.1 hypothetical protein BAUCODRAFT_121704 [Baudoinia panamericana UAMH 10762]
MEGRAPRLGHKKSRKGCAQCKRRHVKCDEEAPCSNCVRHGVPCSLAGGPYVPREDTRQRRASATSSSTVSRTTSQEAAPSSAIATTSNTSLDLAPLQPSPFTVLTGLIDRPVPGQDANWMLDLQLMHHYLTHTKYILTEHQDMINILQIWQEEAPKVAFKHDYLMHALLGFTALHKAHLEPESGPMLRTSAVDHLDKALVLYRENAGPTTAENADAKFAFTWLVALFSYAVPPSVPPIDAIAELFSLVKGIDTMVAETWFWVSQGAFAPILTRGFDVAATLPPESYTLPEGMDFGLGHLDFMLGVDAMMPDERRTCALILAELKQIYNGLLRQQGQFSIASVVCFPKQDSAPFSQLVRRRVPQALVILAYYCVVLDVLDSRWWIHGWSSRVLQDIMSTLDDQWQSWIEWPVQSVLFKAAQTEPSTTDRLGLLI